MVGEILTVFLTIPECRFLLLGAWIGKIHKQVTSFTFQKTKKPLNTVQGLWAGFLPLRFQGAALTASNQTGPIP